MKSKRFLKIIRNSILSKQMANVSIVAVSDYLTG